MKRPVIAVYSLGCAKNLVDSEQALAQMGLAGAAFTNDILEADCIIINTCTFVRDAENESRDAVVEALAAKERGRCRWVFLAGCMGVRYGRDLMEDLPGLDGVYGLFTPKTARRILKRITGRSPRHDRERIAARLRLTPRHLAYLRASDGCDNCCAYCVIPSVRGGLVSRPIEDLVAEAEHLIADGARELVLIAQDTTNYGQDLYGRRALPELLDKLSALSGAEWIRLLYLHPAHLDEAVVDRIESADNILPYVDLPLQHIADGVLRRMGRKIDRSGISRTLDLVRRRVGSVVIRTSFLVGFPGETADEFDELLAFVRDQSFDRVGVFAYSRESGTAAASFDGQLDDEVKASRRDALLTAQQEIAFRLNRERIGERVKVLVDAVDGQQAIGRSYAEAPDVDPVIVLKGDEVEPGALVDAEIVGVADYDLIAQMKGGRS